MTYRSLWCWAVLIAAGGGCAAPSVRPVAAKDYTVACYYFPQWHADPRNDRYYGPGWTEWSYLQEAPPRFAGHEQPKTPLWGCQDESDPAVFARKIDAAAAHGVDVFIFDWYYYDPGPHLHGALDRGFLQAPNHDRIRFALMWCNHDAILELGMVGAVQPETWEKVMDVAIEQYFRHPSYWTIEGRPYFSVYLLHRLIETCGGVERTRAALDDFRARARAAGFPGLHLNVVEWGIHQNINGTIEGHTPGGLIDYLGIDSVTSYTWVHHVLLEDFPATEYGDVATGYFDFWKTADGRYHVPYHPNVTMGWDPSPRCRPIDVPFTNRGYPCMPVIVHNTPGRFAEALRTVRAGLADRPPAERVVTIYAWNEWTEGGYLEPDTRYGMGYLEAVADVFGTN